MNAERFYDVLQFYGLITLPSPSAAGEQIRLEKV